MEYLQVIMDTDIQRKHGFKSMEEILAFEQKYGIDLSHVYKQFLLHYGSGYIKDDYCYKAKEKSPLTPEDDYDMTDYFYGSDIVDNIETYKEEFERKLLPIADAGGGDFICLGVRDKYKDKIYYWTHEGRGKFEENLYLIADTFEDFISSFEKHKHEQKIDLEDIELFLDDDLLND